MEGKQIKVLSVCTSDTSGGAARAAYRIHKGVSESGVDSMMFVKDKHQKDETVIALERFLPKSRIYAGIDWIVSKCKNKFQHFHWRLYPTLENVYLSDLRSTCIHGALRKIDYDILHLHWINLRFLPLRILNRVKKPIIWTLHDSWPFCGVCHYFLECERYKDNCGDCPFLHSGNPLDLSHKILEKKKKIYKDLELHVVTPSRWLAECARNSTLFGKFPVTVIPNCLDTEIFRPLGERGISQKYENYKDKKKTYVLFGAVNATTDKIKGFTGLLEALKVLALKEASKGIELIVFGADKPLDGMPPSLPCHYVGYVKNTEDLVSLYNLASVTVVPSLTENLSCTIMESLSCGTPVVAFDLGGNGDMIDHKRNGYLARKNDDEDLAEGILWCIDNNKDRKLSISARQKVLDNYTSKIVCNQYVELYRELLRK